VNWVVENLDLIWDLSLIHLRQSLIAIALSLVISIPVGALAWRFRLVRGPLLTITGLLYTLPSLALLILLPPLLGLSLIDERNLVIALTIYGVALMVRAVAEGLDSVNPDARLAAVAMGYGSFRRFVRVDLPLAGPVILAGLRVTAVSTIALATVGILVGVQNLGYLFTNGLSRRIIEEVLAGLVVVALIALVIDLLVVLAGRLLLPWTRKVPAVKRAPVVEAAA
jgi:osmoprotectant transport system permease protein